MESLCYFQRDVGTACEIIWLNTQVVVYLIFLPYHQAYPPASIKKLIAPWAEGAEDYYSGYHEVPTSVMLEDRPSNDRIQPNRRKANAAFVVLGQSNYCNVRQPLISVRNSELRAMVNSMKQMEDRFNHWAGYDYVFLNDEVRLAHSGADKAGVHRGFHKVRSALPCGQAKWQIYVLSHRRKVPLWDGWRFPLGATQLVRAY